MPAVRIELYEGRPLLDIGSYGRSLGEHRERLSPSQIAQIERTVHRAPEVMVKVLTRNSNDIASVRRHFRYIGRRGELELETDDGQLLSGQNVGRELVEDWNLKIEQHRRDALTAGEGRKPGKLVHKLMFSMPPGTPPKAVRRAVSNFLREELAQKHRYAFVLHTDERHPHVHAVIKAVSESGERLNIRKATLRSWRAEFARHLRVQGVAANATERAVRGQVASATLDPIYRAMKRGGGESTFMRAKVQATVRRTTHSETIDELARARLSETRRAIEHGWQAVARELRTEGHASLADAASRFAERMPPPRTDSERLAAQIRMQERHTRLLNR